MGIKLPNVLGLTKIDGVKLVIIKPGMVFFMHMILMDSKAQLAMNIGETYLVTETGNERLGNQKLDLVVL